MRKRMFVLAIGMAVIASFAISPSVVAQEPPPTPIPETVQIEDPFGDANGLNDQGQSGTTGHQGENVTPADAGSISDFGKIWFSNTADTVSVHILTEAPPPAINGLRIDVYASPGEGSAAASTLGCARWVVHLRGETQGQPTTWQGDNEARFFDACNDGTNWFNNGVEAEFRVEETAEGNGLMTITAPMSASPFLAIGQSLTAPSAAARAGYGVQGTVAGSVFYTDNTVVGTDYTITAPAGDDDLKPGPGKGKGCDKGKGKKKGCKKGQGGSDSATPTGGRSRAL